MSCHKIGSADCCPVEATGNAAQSQCIQRERSFRLLQLQTKKSRCTFHLSDQKPRCMHGTLTHSQGGFHEQDSMVQRAWVGGRSGGSQYFVHMKYGTHAIMSSESQIQNRQGNRGNRTCYTGLNAQKTFVQCSCRGQNLAAVFTSAIKKPRCAHGTHAYS